MSKVVYIAAGDPERAAADLRDRGLLELGPLLRVATNAASREQLMKLASLGDRQVIAVTPRSAAKVFVALARFLFLSFGSRIVFLRSASGDPILKLLSLALPGKLFISQPGLSFSALGRVELFRATLSRAIEGHGPICVIGSASGESLSRIVGAARTRYPGVEVHGALTGARDEDSTGTFDRVVSAGSAPHLFLKLLPNLIGKGRYRRIFLPLTNEGFGTLKRISFLLPCLPLEAYNEHLDSFGLRSVVSIGKHLAWRFSENRERRKIAAARRFQSLPVAVVGSASAYYLKKIVPIVRERFPKMEIRGYLPESVVGPAAGLFDLVAILPSNPVRLLWRALWLSRTKVQCLVVPFTDEPYFRYQFAALTVLHAGPKRAFNEVADGFALRDARMLYRHFRWRLKDRLSYQIVAGADGGNALVRAFHVAFYPFRLIRGLSTLVNVRVRSRFRKPADAASSSEAEDAAVAVIYLETAGRDREAQLPVFGRNEARIQLAAAIDDFDSPRDLALQVDAAIRASRATFVCLFDSNWQTDGDGWLDRILDVFDSKTAQAGPGLLDEASGVTVCGALLSGQRDVRQPDIRWIGPDEACYIRRPEYLKVDALPWDCVVIRRSAYLSAGGFGGAISDEWPLVDREFCQRLLAAGWTSVCHTDVVARRRVPAAAGEMESVRYSGSMTV